MKTAIIVATFNRPEMVKRLLASLPASQIAPDVELFIVENGPKTGVESVCRTSSLGGPIHYLYCAVANKSAALNHAIRQVEADFIVFFDDDILVSPGTVATYIEAAHRYGSGHFFGGPFDVDTEVSCPEHLIPYLPLSDKNYSFADAEKIISPDEFLLFVRSNWAAFRSDLLQVGLFREDIGFTASRLSPDGEETDIQRALVLSSVLPVNLPQAHVRHFVGRNCYTSRRVRNRQFRHALADCIFSMERGKGRIAEFPKWAIRELAANYLLLLWSYLAGKSIAERTQRQMRISYLHGWLYGAIQNWPRARQMRVAAVQESNPL